MFFMLFLLSYFPHLFISAQIVPLSPDVDPFYKPPAGYAASLPGTVFRSRTVIASFLSLIPIPVDTHQLLYRTTAINGTPIVTATTVFKPANAATDRFVSFQIAEDSSALFCAPSYEIRLLANQSTESVEALVLLTYLSKGYVVATPDYEGPDSAFSAGRLEGMGVLDGMRAVNNFASTFGLASSNSAIVATGYSGGAIATGWAASLQPEYAPELNVKGWISGGTPANLTGTLVNIDGTAFAGFLPAALAGLRKLSAYGAALRPLFDAILTSSGKEYLGFADVHCSTDTINVFVGKRILSYDFQSLGPQLLYNPTFASVLLLQTMGLRRNETPTAPVLLYHAAPDEVIPYTNASTLYHNWCNNGAGVHFTTFAAGGHLTTRILGVPGALAFAASAFAGSLGSGCSQSTVLSNTLDPLALGLDLEPLTLDLINELLLLGQQTNSVD